MASSAIAGRSRSVSAASADALLALDAFALRQFDRGQAASAPGFIDYDPELFAAKVNQICQERLDACPAGQSPLIDGYAPFCKHLFVPDFTKSKVSSIEITPQNQHLLRSDYIARTAQELPVLTRWFPRDLVEVPSARFLDVILYSRDQINKENLSHDPDFDTSRDQEYPWGIISVKPQLLEVELPMSPITMMRNALPLAEGGSGVPLNHKAYQESVNIWKRLASVI